LGIAELVSVHANRYSRPDLHRNFSAPIIEDTP
jgi:hypothetical protein